MNDWKWYFTPDIGINGSAVEIQDLPTGERKIRKITHVIVNPTTGQMGFSRWLPLFSKICEPIGYVGILTLFPANESVVQTLEDFWKTEGTIIQPGNGRLKLT